MTPAAVAAAFRERIDPTGGTLEVRAPGRANLIGEHIDYNGLSVLPMALQRHVLLELRPRTDTRIRLENVDPRYDPLLVDMAADIPPGPPGDWGNYVRAAAQALCRDHGALTGFDGMVGSDLPVAAGLSSSSALVVACALALLEVNGLALDRLALMARLAEAERYVGLAGGGMDQAICLGGVEGSACRVSFDPLTIEPHAIPSGWRFLIGFSLVPAEKSAGARRVYNRRTEEGRLARRAVAERVGLPVDTSYPELLARFAVEELLTVGDEALEAPLRQRFRHVVTEGRRVDRAVQALAAGDLEGMGSLLTASHRSLRDDYEVSSPELDELVRLCLEGGAVGARVTGAGLGGSIVALGSSDAVESIVDHLDREFYNDQVAPTALDSVRFEARAGGGAAVTSLVS